ncbi:SCO7613 C-terminal domain-containing membrane protein [Luedemannella flava]
MAVGPSAQAGSSLARALRGAVTAALPLAALEVPAVAAILGARWPTVPLLCLVVGAAGLAFAALRPAKVALTVGWTFVGVVALAAGVVGALPTRASTLVALGAVLVLAVVVGAAGRSSAVRAIGWGAVTIAVPVLAVASVLAAGLTRPWPAVALVGSAIVLLALGVALLRRGGAHAAGVLEPGAHAVAAVAFLTSLGRLTQAAVVAAVWGAVLAVRAVVPGTRANARRALVGSAAGLALVAWWLFMASRTVAVVEAYTLPFAAVALFAGWLALRARPVLGSWQAYGPALAVAFLPSLAPILATEGDPVRRLVLGAAALAVVVAGAARRLQAPVVLGGLVLAVVALHELVLLGQKLPTWVPLSVGGALLLGIAATFERRRRDLARLRETVGRLR